MTIDGQKRGALSWFSRAIEGRADKDSDGEVSEFELLGYIVPAVHALVESQQSRSRRTNGDQARGEIGHGFADPSSPGKTDETNVLELLALA